MSGPKTGTIRVVNDKAARDQAKAARRHELQMQRIAQQAQAKQEALRATEERRRRSEARAAELAQERDERAQYLKKLQEAQREAIRQAEIDKRVSHAKRRAQAAATELARLAAAVTQSGITVRADSTAVDSATEEPSGNEPSVHEAWAKSMETRLSAYLAAIGKEMAATADRDQVAMINKLCEGIASHARTGEAVLLSTITRLGDQTAGMIDAELERHKSTMHLATELLNDSDLPASYQTELSSVLGKLSSATSLSAMNSGIKNLAATCSAAATASTESRERRNQLEQLLTAWQQTGVSVPKELEDGVAHQDSVSAEDLSLWRTKWEVAESRLKQEHADAEAAHKEETRKFIAANLEQALQNLGYDVEPIAHTMFAQGGKIYASKPAWNGHFIEISPGSDANSDRLSARCVKPPTQILATTDTADRVVEAEWCQDLHFSMRDLKATGIALNIDGVDANAPKVAALSTAEYHGSAFVQRHTGKLAQQNAEQPREME